ncbi:hypothetical protein ACFOWX_03820 [Sphingorhabdus arenilitoris]|uniref:Lipoprotein n=1 Tax=Sphingorhabdus arenilitoris TaxID=1490041 RepID=A0ABV8RDV8_9SPHN
MKTRIYYFALILLASSCSVPAPPPTSPAPAPRTAPPVSAPADTGIKQPTGSWLDWDIAPGSWVYRQDGRGSIALFGETGRDALVTLRCDRGRGQLYLARADESGTGAGSFTIRSHAMMKSYSAGTTGGTPPYVAVALAPTDTILDAVAFTRGRIAIEAAGQKHIAIPIWSEVPRVIDDCR